MPESRISHGRQLDCLDPRDSGIEEIHQVPVPINDPINLPRLSCLGLCCSISRGSAVLGLVVAIGAELIAVLDDELGSRHSGQGIKEQNSQ